MAISLVAVLLVAYPFTSSVATTSSQAAFSTPFFQVPVKQVNTPILVRNSGNTTVNKPDTTPAPAAVSAKDNKVEDKKAMGRCWKRLMNMIREVNHAHRIRKNTNQ